MIFSRLCISALLYTAITFSTSIFAGPFAPAAGQSGSTAIAASDPSIQSWAGVVESYLPGSNIDAEFQTPNKALNTAGDSNGLGEGFIFDIVSLGRGGQITLTFYPPITNGSGYDFAVFENSFSDGFLELAWVEVSSNSVDYFRFIGASLTPNPIGAFTTSMDPTDITGFAGKYRGGYGAPFDLDELPDDPNLDKSAITHVRLIDIVGDGTTLDDTVLNNPVYDPYPTVSSAGFDLDAIAALHIALPDKHNVPLPPVTTFLLAVFLSIGFHLTKQKTLSKR